VICDRIIYVQHIEMCGCVLYRAICKKDLEGIICKKKSGMYSVSGQWLKGLNQNYTQHEDRHEIFTTPQSSTGRVSR
jgi:ATP-dependent DNA ligase